MIIGLTGPKRSGKDTVAQYLVEQYGFERHGFADLLKQAVANLFDLEWEEVDRYKNEDVGISIVTNVDSFGKIPLYLRELSWRHFLQRFGTEMGRETFGYNFWVDQFWPRYDHIDKLVISDVRFENEAFSIGTHGGSVWEVFRLDVVSNDTHVSEHPLDDEFVSRIIVNNGSLEELYDHIDNLMGSVKR